MEKLRFEIKIKDSVFWIYPAYLMFGLFFLFINSNTVGAIILGLGTISIIPVFFDYNKLKKLKKHCTQIEPNIYEISCGKIKEYFPINLKEYSIETQTGEFRITPLFVKNFEDVEKQINRKMEEGPTLKIDSTVNFLFMFSNLYIAIGFPYFFLDNANFNLTTGFIMIFVLSSFRSFLTDLIFIISTNPTLKRYVTIQNDEITSATKIKIGLLNVRTKGKTLRLWSDNLNFKRITNYLIKHRHLPIEEEQENEFSTLKFICIVVFFAAVMMIVTYYGF